MVVDWGSIELWGLDFDCFVFFSSRRRHTRSGRVTGVQTCALPISIKIRITNVKITIEAAHITKEIRKVLVKLVSVGVSGIRVDSLRHKHLFITHHCVISEAMNIPQYVNKTNQMLHCIFWFYRF